ncbi:DNA-binding protein [Pectobacterium carotovorum]|uniref:H-NS family histone-like protein n=1 Tax=Pectobacterium carotovorum TaxID=554 RepID=UPI00193CBFAF|nr:DNA-binding protein [Pectobacterium carotovorum]QRN39221.1 DNA-binding protein [Pectobacterium carotovorum]
MIDEFHVMFMYKKIQAEAATTDIKTLNQLLKKFRKVVEERREEYYQDIRVSVQDMMEKDRVSVQDIYSISSD